MNKQKISESDTSTSYGISTQHEEMPNGELRFRLMSADGCGYIRTLASDTGAWQMAHSHSALRETYIIEKGWMALAERQENILRIKVHWPGDVATIRPTVAHNVYLPANAVIHTVKHGSNRQGDWNEEPELTEETQSLTEKDIFLKGVGENTSNRTADPRFDAYVALYNNLDNLIWQIPGLLAAGAAILIGFAGSAIAKPNEASIPAVLITGLFFFVGLLFFLSAFSLHRIRKHHTLTGNLLADMEPDGYFHLRQKTVARSWPPSAPSMFMLVYLVLSVMFWVLALITFFRYKWLMDILKWTS